MRIKANDLELDFSALHATADQVVTIHWSAPASTGSTGTSRCPYRFAKRTVQRLRNAGLQPTYINF